MRVNKDGVYEVTEGEKFIIDPSTGEKMVFMMDAKEKLVIRSMLEEDIKASMSISRATSSEKRKRCKELWDIIPRPQSETFFYILEIVSDEDGNKNPYERKREIVGIGIRTENDIQFRVWKNVDDSDLDSLPEMVKQLAREFNIKGEPYCLKK